MIDHTITSEQKVEKLRAKGWVCRDRFWWPPVMKEVIDRKARRPYGVGINRAFGMVTAQEADARHREAVKKYEAEIVCNKCGVDLRKYDTNANLAKTIPMTPAEPKDEPHCCGYYGLREAQASGGYWSEHLSDGLTYRFSLCERCLVELMDTFTIPANKECYL